MGILFYPVNIKMHILTYLKTGEILQDDILFSMTYSNLNQFHFMCW